MDPSARNLEIYHRSILEGETTHALAAAYGVTSPRISQIIHRVGETRHGKHLTVRELRERERKLNGADPVRRRVP